MKKILYIIRFADNTLASHYGTYEGAKAIAEEKKTSTGEVT